MTWGEALTLAGVATGKTVATLTALPCPAWWPQSLDAISYADLVALQRSAAKGYASLAMMACEVLLEVDAAKAVRLPAADVAGLTNMVLRELERIGKLFERCKVEPSAVEKQAMPPQGDWFTMIDWYARRMGYVDHDAASLVCWQYYYRCAWIDAEQGRYERRRAKIQADELKRKQKRR